MLLTDLLLPVFILAGALVGALYFTTLEHTTVDPVQGAAYYWVVRLCVLFAGGAAGCALVMAVR